MNVHCIVFGKIEHTPCMFVEHAVWMLANIHSLKASLQKHAQPIKGCRPGYSERIVLIPSARMAASWNFRRLPSLYAVCRLLDGPVYSQTPLVPPLGQRPEPFHAALLLVQSILESETWSATSDVVCGIFKFMESYPTLLNEEERVAMRRIASWPFSIDAADLTFLLDNGIYKGEGERLLAVEKWVRQLFAEGTKIAGTDLGPLVIQAAKHGLMYILLALRDRWGSGDPETNSVAAIWAATYGHLDILEFLNDTNNVDFGFRGNSAAFFASRLTDPPKRLAVLRFLKDKPGVDFGNVDIALKAAENGYIDVLQFLKNETTVDMANPQLLVFAARKNQIKVMDFLKEIPGVYTSEGINEVVEAGIKLGQLAVLQFLDKYININNIDFFEIYNAADDGGSVEILKFLETKGLDLTNQSTEYIVSRQAAFGGNVDVLRFLRTRIGGARWLEILDDPEYDIILGAAFFGRVNVLQYIHQESSLLYDDERIAKMVNNAVSKGRINVLQFLVDIGADLSKYIDASKISDPAILSLVKDRLP